LGADFLTVHGLLSAMLQMKRAMLLVALAICIVCAMSASDCSPPLNCTGVYNCPLLQAGPGVIVESGAQYCSCCPVTITYLGMFHVPSASCSLVPNYSVPSVDYLQYIPPGWVLGGPALRRTGRQTVTRNINWNLRYCTAKL
jgi:hypothetical protein